MTLTLQGLRVIHPHLFDLNVRVDAKYMMLTPARESGVDYVQ